MFRNMKKVILTEKQKKLNDQVISYQYFAHSRLHEYVTFRGIMANLKSYKSNHNNDIAMFS